MTTDREDARDHDPEVIEDRIDRETAEHEGNDQDDAGHLCPICEDEIEPGPYSLCGACERTEADWDRL